MEGLGAGGTDRFLGELARWAAADRAAQAASERAKLRSLVDQAAGAATWAGLLVDLAEAEAEVTISVVGGSRTTGTVTATARDFVALERSRSGPLLVYTRSITSVVRGRGPGVRAAGGAGRSGLGGAGGGGGGGGGGELPPGGRRPPVLDLTLAGALDVLAGEGAPISVRCGDETVGGRALACGADLLTLRVDGTEARSVYLPLTHVVWVELR